MVERMDTIPGLVPVTRPNGKVYRPKKPPAGVIVHDHHNDARWIYILRTHGIERARALAEQIATREGFDLDEDEVLRGWVREGMQRGERFYFNDAVRGLPTVIFWAGRMTTVPARRIQRKRIKGWRMPEGAVYVGRPSQWGNEWTMQDAIGWEIPIHQRRRWLVERFRADVQNGMGGAPRLADIRDRLAGKDLVCWCPLDQPCHADVLLEIANDEEARGGA